MAMEKQFVVRDTHTRAITALGYNPGRREILMGCADGVIKAWEAETGNSLQLQYEHRGWITNFLYWGQAKIMLSAANDGFIVAWGSGGGLADKIQIGMPVYCMAINARRRQIVCGMNAGIRVYALDEERECGHLINNHILYIAKEHTDIVRNLFCHESRIYSAGYDQKLIIYDSSYTGDNSMEAFYINHHAHDAGISCLLMARDSDSNIWIVTGSFDKTVKIWSVDGKLIHKRDNFISTVTGLCYVPNNKTIWAVGGTSYASLFDPKSGDNVSDFIGTFQDQEEEKYQLQHLRYFPEFNQVVASTSRRHLIVWKYQSSGCITALKRKTAFESLCYTQKEPILMFSGDSEGVITKWERMQSNHFTYSKELFFSGDSKYKKKMRAQNKSRELNLENQLLSSLLPSNMSRTEARTTPKTKQKTATSHYAFNKPMIPPVSTHNHPNTSILKIVFVEALDLIIAASEDSHIYVWGYDAAAVNVLQNMKPQDLESLVGRFGVLLDEKSSLLPKNLIDHQENTSVTNRVAGFVCKYVLTEHTSCVTSLVVIDRSHGFGSTFVLSAGWDRRICIWDLEEGHLHDNFRSATSVTGTTQSQENLELACDGVILDMAYAASRNEFAYASGDKMVYIRKFSINGSEMKLKNTLQGHESEITCLQWNELTGKWVTGSEDGTIRVWAGVGMNECETVLSVQGGVGCLCLDHKNGAIVAGVQNTIRVYESDAYRLVQSNVGHSDSIRSIIHISERNQYISCSWDQTIRIWNSWKKPPQRRKVSLKTEKSMNNAKVPEVNVVNEDGDELRGDDSEEEFITEEKSHPLHNDSEMRARDNTSSSGGNATTPGGGSSHHTQDRRSSQYSRERSSVSGGGSTHPAVSSGGGTSHHTQDRQSSQYSRERSSVSGGGSAHPAVSSGGGTSQHSHASP